MPKHAVTQQETNERLYRAGEWVHLRARLSVSQEAFAEQLGISVSEVKRVEWAEVTRSLQP